MRTEWETRHYPVPGQHLGWMKSAFDNAGYPVGQVIPQAGGMYIIVVSLPSYVPQEFDPRYLGSYRPQPRRRAWRWTPDWRRLVTLALLLVIVAAAGWTVYSAAQPEADTEAGNSLAELAYGLWPDGEELPAGEPVVERTGPWAGLLEWWDGMREDAPAGEAPPSWPPKNPVGDAVDGMMGMLTALLYVALIILLVLLAFALRGPIGAVVEAVARTARGGRDD